MKWIDDDAGEPEGDDEEQSPPTENEIEPRFYVSRTGERIETRLDMPHIEKNSQQVRTNE